MGAGGDADVSGASRLGLESRSSFLGSLSSQYGGPSEIFFSFSSYSVWWIPGAAAFRVVYELQDSHVRYSLAIRVILVVRMGICHRRRCY